MPAYETNIFLARMCIYCKRRHFVGGPINLPPDNSNNYDYEILMKCAMDDIAY